jgi:hypothetical protein
MSEGATNERTDQETALARALGAPFDEAEVKFKPQTVSGNRALAIPYVDARVIQDRLDDVLGVMGWQDSYECLPDGAVVCRLKIRLGEEWIVKEDVGSPSEQPDEGDRRKAAFSDALKRAAVKFGIGRYLYRQKPQWVDYDPQKRSFTRKPTLQGQPASPPPPAHKPPAAPANTKPAATGEEFYQRLREYDTKLAKEGLCHYGDLVKYIARAGKEAGLDPDLTTWDQRGIDLARKKRVTFEEERRAQAADKAQAG